MYSEAAIKKHNRNRVDADLSKPGWPRGDRQTQIQTLLRMAELIRYLQKAEESRKPLVIQLLNSAKKAYEEAKESSYRGILSFLKSVKRHKDDLVSLGLSKVVGIAGKSLRPLVLSLLLRLKSHGDSKLMLTDSKAIKRYIDKAVARELMRRRVDGKLDVLKKSDKLAVRRKRKDGPSDIALKAVLNVEYALDKIKTLIGNSEGKAKAIWNAAVNAVKSSKVANKGYDKVASLLEKLKQTVLDKTARRLTQKAIDAINEVTQHSQMSAGPTGRMLYYGRHIQKVLEKLPNDIANEIDPDLDLILNKQNKNPWKNIRDIVFKAVSYVRRHPELDDETKAIIDEIRRVAGRAFKELKSYGDMPKSK